MIGRLRRVDRVAHEVEHWLDWFGLEPKRDTGSRTSPRASGRR